MLQKEAQAQACSSKNAEKFEQAPNHDQSRSISNHCLPKPIKHSIQSKTRTPSIQQTVQKHQPKPGPLMSRPQQNIKKPKTGPTQFSSKQNHELLL
ncbi:hypothetical protein U1Q18_005732 [Sarracenia purpurea var. burkii]